MREFQSVLVHLICLGYTYAAQQDSHCEYADRRLSCVCGKGVDMTLSYIPPDANTLTISDCEQVSFGGTPFKGCRLDRLEIANSSSLRLQDSTFLDMERINQVEFVNILNLQVQSLYFLKADEVEMRNVTIRTLNRYAVPGIASIKVLRFLNSRIGAFTNGSLHFGNDTSLEIIGCKIGLIESNGLTVENVGSFTIQRSEFLLEEDALNLMNVSKVSIVHNEIHTTAVASFLASDIGEFRVTNNNFRHVGNQTFYHMGNLDKVVLENNRFLRVDEEGLEFHPEAGKSLFAIRNNRFICDCNLFWLWREQKHPSTADIRPEFKMILNSSLCDRPDALAGLLLLEITPLVKRETDECIRMESVVEEEKKNAIRGYPMTFSNFKSSSAPSKTALNFLSLLVLSIGLYLIESS